MIPSRILVSREGLARLQERLDRLKAEWRTLCEERTTAHELCGDGWHDNPYLNQLQQQEARKTRELSDVEALLARAEVVSVTSGERPIDRVALGAIVRVRRSSASGSEHEQIFEVVGWGESDHARGRVAYNAPLVQPLLGLGAGDEVESGTGRAHVVTTVLELFPEWPEETRLPASQRTTAEIM